MNSSNDPLDKRLQQRFQQLFASEDTVVDDALKQQIWNRLPPTAPRTHLSAGLLLLLSGILICVSIGLYYGSASVVSMSRQVYLSVRHAAGQYPASHPQTVRTSPSRLSRSPRESVVAHPLEAIDHSVSKPDRQSTELSDVSLHSLVLDAPHTKRSDKAILSPKAVSRRNGHKRIDLRLKESEPVGLVHGPTMTLSAGPSRNKHKQRRVLTGSAISATGLVSLPTLPEVGNDSLVNEPVINWAPLQATRHVAIGSADSPLSAQLNQRVDFLTPLTTSAKTASKQLTHAVDWFFSAAPFSTYQRMTIVPKTDTYVRNVTSPNPWSSQTWGYQLSGGIRWSGWDVALSYGQLRRWAYYDRAIDAYEIKPSGPTAYQVTRQTEAVAEDVALSLVGIGIARTQEWSKHRRYYARAGAQLSYVLPTHQALGWLETSWGLTLPVGNQYRLQVGPRLAYSLSDIWSTDRQLRIHSYTAGLSLTIRP